MSLHRKRRRRNSNQECCVFEAYGPQGLRLRIVRRISQWAGDSLVRQGKAIRHDGADSILGYEMVVEKKVALARTYQTVAAPTTSGPCVCISRAEVEANAGLRGHSRTVGLSEAQRIERMKRNLPDMDLVESTAEKLRVYRSVH